MNQVPLEFPENTEIRNGTVTEVAANGIAIDSYSRAVDLRAIDNGSAGIFASVGGRVQDCVSAGNEWGFNMVFGGGGYGGNTFAGSTTGDVIGSQNANLGGNSCDGQVCP